jgi:O-palmitoleoyl-L-serine hydrolase
VHLQGGAWCYDQASCTYRMQSSPDLTSSIGYSATSNDHGSGLFSTNSTLNAAWYNANVAYIMYCSSDSWSGNTSTTLSGTPWTFQGRRIIESVFLTLARSYGLKSASDVLFSGCSAGGQGVVVNVDYVASILKRLGLRMFHSPTHSPTHSLTHSPTHPLTHMLSF